MPSAIAHSQNGWYVGAGSHSGKATWAGIGGSATAIEGGRRSGNYTAGVKVLSAEGAVGRVNRRYTIGGEVTLAKYSGSYTFKARGRTITVGGSIGIGVGGRASAGRGGFGVSVYRGAGFSLDVRW